MEIKEPHEELENILIKMHRDLKSYADMPTAKMNVVHAKEFVLNALIKNYNQLDLTIKMLNDDNRKLTYQNMFLKTQIAMHQAILIIHGVYQFPMWLNKGWEHLEYEAVRADREKFYKLPDKFAEDLTPEERQMFSDRSARYFQQQFIESLQSLPNSEMLIAKYNQLCSNPQI